MTSINVGSWTTSAGSSIILYEEQSSQNILPHLRQCCVEYEQNFLWEYFNHLHAVWKNIRKCSTTEI